MSPLGMGNPAWKKGVSGNPNGRPRYSKAFKNALTKGVMPAMRVLLEIMNNPEASEMARIKCAEIILDRQYGKAPQPLTDSEGGNLQGATYYIGLPVKADEEKK